MVTGERSRVLVIEDDALLREAVVETLRRIDVEVDAVSSLEDATERLERGRDYQAVISDLGLPDHERSVLDAIPRSLAGLPVILVTGTTSARVEERARRAGAFRFLRKPVSARTLRGVVRDALGQTPRAGGEP